MPRNRFDLIGAGAGIGEARCGRLAQPMRGALWEACQVALLAKPVAKAGGRKRPAECGEQERQIGARYRP
jgi:hypothetical protein